MIKLDPRIKDKFAAHGNSKCQWERGCDEECLRHGICKFVKAEDLDNVDIESCFEDD